MDAETRHHLKQNELAEALGRLKSVKAEYVRYALLIVTVLVVAVVGYRLWSYSHQKAIEHGWAELYAIHSELDDKDKAASARDRLRKLIDSSSDHALRGYARIQLAGLVRNDAYRDPAKRDDLLKQANQELGAVLADSSVDSTIQAVALFALATNEESLGQFAEARQHYETLVNDAKYDGSAFKQPAAKRLEDIDKIASEKITLQPGDPPPSSEPAVQNPIGTKPPIPININRK